MSTPAPIWTRIGVGVQCAGAAAMIGAGEWQIMRMIPRLSPTAAIAVTGLNLVAIGLLLLVLGLLRLIWDRLARLERGVS